MRYLLFLLLISTALFGNDPYKNIVHYRLDNGLEVYLYPDQKAKNVAISVDVKVGLKAENEKSAGISHLVEHIVFRDARIEDRDYLDLFKKEGASYVNGFTTYYKTQYVTTIKSQKAYWVVDQFAKMLLDKNITIDDLEAERGALQVEIGEFTWADKVLPIIKKSIDFVKDLFPSQPNFYRDEFGIDIKDENREYYPNSIYRANNQRFTFKDVLKHYNEYYYPSNMILSVVGNFDPFKMKETIRDSFGKFKDHDGKSVERKIYKTAKLNQKSYEQYLIGVEQNLVTIGTKFIADDPKKVIILKSYVKDLADRLNRVFRNKYGESYGAFGEYNSYHNAAIATVSFNVEHNAFDKNIKYAQEQIEKEANGKLSDKMIHEALKASKKRYGSYEHDTGSLMDILSSYREFQKVFDSSKNPYEILNDITTDEFRATIEQTFIPKNSYKYIARDYIFFPYEMIIFLIISLIAMFYFIHKFFGSKVHTRVILQRRLTSKFISFFVILSAIVFSALITEWIFYLMTRYLPISKLWINGYDAPLSYLIYFFDFLFSMMILYIVIRTLYKWFYIKLFVTDHTLILSGVKNKYINIADISSIDVARWSPSLIGNIHGVSLFFWKPLLKITSHYNDVVYLRSKNAKSLKSDLEFAIFEKDRRGKRW